MEPPAPAIEPVPVVVPVRRKGQPLIAWLVIVAGVLFVAWGQLERHDARAPGAEGPRSQMLLELQARLLVGTARLQGTSAAGTASLTKQVAALNTGSAQQRLAAAILTGELSGPEAAREQLAALPDKLHLTPQQENVRLVLLRLYSDYAAGRWTAPSVDEAERNLLRRALGWFGTLALAPAAGPDQEARATALAPAQRTALVLTVFALFIMATGAVGLVGLLLFVVFWLSGRLRMRLQTGSPLGGIYAETFAVWMVLFWGLTLLVGLVHAGPYRFLLLGVPGLLSLLALAWPVLRGYSWRQVRHEIGLSAGPMPAVEPVVGLATYALALPLVVVGALVMYALLLIQKAARGTGGTAFDPGEVPSHPIVDALVYGSGWERLQLFVLACVLAPLVEETMFRGVLYRHLREATGKLRPVLSALLSATVVSFLFAVIHPQGLVAVPVLMALAYAFALAREWRGSLVPGMVAHGLNNGIAFTLVLVAMSA